MHAPSRRTIPTALVTAALLAGCGAGATVVTDVDFETTDDPARGWTVVGDGELGSEAGEVREGALVGEDDAVGGVWYFAAPADVAAALEPSAVVSFELRLAEEPAEPFDAPDVVVGAGDTALHAQLPTTPSAAWTSYELDLDLLDWQVGAITDGELEAGLDDPGATADQIAEVLSSADRLWIRGEYNTGDDTGYLDDVRITIG